MKNLVYGTKAYPTVTENGKVVLPTIMVYTTHEMGRSSYSYWEAAQFESEMEYRESFTSFKTNKNLHGFVELHQYQLKPNQFLLIFNELNQMRVIIYLNGKWRIRRPTSTNIGRLVQQAPDLVKFLIRRFAWGCRRSEVPFISTCPHHYTWGKSQVSLNKNGRRMYINLHPNDQEALHATLPWLKGLPNFTHMIEDQKWQRYRYDRYLIGVRLC